MKQFTVYKPLKIRLQTNMATIKFYEYLALAIVWPLASIIYLLLQFNWPTIPAILLPLILILFLVLVFLAITPCQYWTALGITAELTGTTVVGLLQDVPDLRTSFTTPFMD